VEVHDRISGSKVIVNQSKDIEVLKAARISEPEGKTEILECWSFRGRRLETSEDWKLMIS